MGLSPGLLPCSHLPSHLPPPPTTACPRDRAGSRRPAAQTAVFCRLLLAAAGPARHSSLSPLPTPTAPHTLSLSLSSSANTMSERGAFRGRGGARGGDRGGRGGGRGGGGAHGAGAGGAAHGHTERPKKENILDLSKYMDKQITVKFSGGREGT